MTSDSANDPKSATRCLSGPATDTRAVCEPVINDCQSNDAPPSAPGKDGNPNRAVSLTVPDNATDELPSTAVSNSAADFGGKVESPLAEADDRATPPPTTAPKINAGTSHAARERGKRTYVVIFTKPS